MLKKVTLLLVVVLVFSFSFVVSANQAGDVEFVGGITYNTFDLTMTDQDGEETNMVEDMEENQDIDISSLDSGFGINAGAIYWLDSQIGLEAGVDAAFGSDSDTMQEDNMDIAELRL